MKDVHKELSRFQIYIKAIRAYPKSFIKFFVSNENKNFLLVENGIICPAESRTISLEPGANTFFDNQIPSISKIQVIGPQKNVLEEFSNLKEFLKAIA